ncbi:uncharacterized protein [Centruroides vittatus]|uniref:uncharacterized protein n=1 Tax=Centruroides vittatus TaxID=120091 RepID=UPI00350FF218
MTRPDIAHIVSHLSKYNNAFDRTHWKAVKRVFKYLKGTADVVLSYERNGEIDIVGFCDADYASDEDDRKSYSGYCFKIGNNLVSWSSCKQTTVSLSTCEAEYVAITEASKEAIWLKSLLREVLSGELKTETTCIFSDNQAAICLANGEGSHKRAKHIDIKLHFVKDLVSEGKIKLKHISTENMPADVLTKALGPNKHKKCCKLLGLNIR